MLSQLPSWLGAYEGMFMQFILNFRKELTNSENPNTFGNLSDAARNVEALSEKKVYTTLQINKASESKK